MSLDELYGNLAVPEPCTDEERTVTPTSLTYLSSETAPLLQSVMKSAEQGLDLLGCVFSQTMMLWVVDEAGNVRLAVEEVLMSTTKRFLRPRLKQQAIGLGEVRLGHPSLVRGGAARIGGELLFDFGYGTIRRGWVLTNGSGRYGMIQGRSRAQLENVGAVFSSFGLKVQTHFFA